MPPRCRLTRRPGLAQALSRSHNAVMAENSTLRDRLQMAELALAMESYPSAPPDSLVAQCEQQVRSAALEVRSPALCEARCSLP